LIAGVASIEHGIWLDDEAIEMMKARDVFLVPTLVAPLQVIRQAEANPGSMPPWAVEKAKQVVKDHMDSFRRAVDSGVKVAMGTDSGVGPHGENAEEIEIMTQLGMSPMDAIVATTSRAAELLRMDGQIGTVRAGSLADLILIDGDPLADIAILRDVDRVVMVMKGGAVFKDQSGIAAGTGSRSGVAAAGY
jgi:imidazolonepropionase-like amidohydrolase